MKRNRFSARPECWRKSQLALAPPSGYKEEAAHFFPKQGFWRTFTKFRDHFIIKRRIISGCALSSEDIWEFNCGRKKLPRRRTSFSHLPQTHASASQLTCARHPGLGSSARSPQARGKCVQESGRFHKSFLKPSRPLWAPIAGIPSLGRAEDPVLRPV